MATEWSCGRFWRAGLGAGVLALCLAARAVSADAWPDGILVRPLLLSYTRYDHHLIQWLPDHERYEAVEALVTDDPERPAVRVFFTEKEAHEGSKRQFFYVNDPDDLQALSGAAGGREVRLTDIRYERTDTPTGPRFRFELSTADGEVAWDFQCQGQPSSDHAPGLINNADAAHDLRSGILIFYLAESAVSGPSTVLTIAGRAYPVTLWTEISRPPYFTAYRAVYSKGADVGYISAGHARARLLPAVEKDRYVWFGTYSWRQPGRETERLEQVVAVVSTGEPVPSEELPLMTVQVSDGMVQTESLSLADGGEVLVMSFSPPLPDLARMPDGDAECRWTISVAREAYLLRGTGQHADLMKGRMGIRKAGRHVSVLFAPEEPAWAQRLGMEVDIEVRQRQYSLDARTIFKTPPERPPGEQPPAGPAA
jgi:hypothetical protein